MRHQRIQSAKTYFTAVNLTVQSLFPSVEKQKNRLTERKNANSYLVKFEDFEIRIDRGVYRTGIDTQLMVNVLKKIKKESFLEIGCGTGAISISLSKNFMHGIAADINDLAITNTIYNCNLNNVSNVEVKKSDVFSNIDDKFDVIICNPPYNLYPAKDDIEKMFWDTGNAMKLAFFQNVRNYLKQDGKIYFGWADFADLDFHFPIRIAKQNGLKLVNTFYSNSKCGANRFIVFEFEIEL